MIPIQLSLHNFLSYRSATLELSGIHTACICGPNGAGKSALLEALTWGIWGQSRAGSDDDVVHKGTGEVQVEVVYRSHDQIYRILRSHKLKGSTSLEWQVQSGSGWRSLTSRGLRATQQAIQTQLRLDYDTFINSAYLRQGRADEFTLKRPNERKQILAEILKLGQYEHLADRCREQGRIAKLQVEQLQEQARRLQAQQATVAAIEVERYRLSARLAQLNTEQERDQAQIALLKERASRRQLLQQRQQQLSEQIAGLSASLQTTDLQWRQQRQRQQDLEALLQQEPTIVAGCRQHERLQARDQQLNEQFQRHQTLLAQRQQLQHTLTEQQQGSLQVVQRLQAEISTLQARQQADEQVLLDRGRIEAALRSYRRAKGALEEHERRQAQAAPLQDQYQRCQQDLRQARERLLAQSEVLQQQVRALHEQHHHLQVLQRAAVAVEVELADLEERRAYQQQVLEKERERQSFVHQLQERQRSLQRQWQQLEEKRHLIQKLGSGQGSVCPLCERSLCADLRAVVVQKQASEQSDLEEQIFVIREQLAVADREIQLLRHEHQELGEQLRQADHHLQAQGRLQQQLESGQTQAGQLRAWQQELAIIQSHLDQESYGDRSQLAEVEASLAAIGYSDKDHALCRAELERWRWAEGRWAEWQRAEQRATRLKQDLAQLQARLAAAMATAAETMLPLQELDAQIQSLDYDIEEHQAVRAELAQTQSWMAAWQSLQAARQQLPACQSQCQVLAQILMQQRQTFAQTSQQMEDLHRQLASQPPVAEAELRALNLGLQERRHNQDRILAQLGAVEQQLQQLTQLDEQQAALAQQLSQARRQQQVYQELTNAYGRNGIPALLIENALPELEAEANQILSRLTHNQLHLQFVTQRSGRRSSKLIDTLDILIADLRGTRPYETYSGGEAFRINFAIRLALSRLLAHRVGSHLQTLLIDEGFGSQDQAGRQQLVAAINAVSADFACILVITHIPSLRDAFPSRIQIERSPHGSRLQVLG